MLVHPGPLLTPFISQLLAGFTPADATEAADVARLRAAIDAGDVFARTSALHVTGSALVVHPPSCRVLLRWHPRMAMWMQVGGHFDAGEHDPLVVVLREAHEETGLTDLQVLDGAPQPVQIVIVPVPAHGDEPEHEHADFRYILATATPDAIVAESAAARLRWLDLDTALDEMTEPNLRELISRVRRRFEPAG